MVAEQISTAIAEIVGHELDFTVERPKQAEHGDYATNAALVLAKQDGKNPREVAEALKEKLRDDLFESIEIAGPGFLNFKVKPVAWQDVLAHILKAKKRYGTFPKTDQKVQVEFISANPTGPLHLGNGRGGFSGDVLANVLTLAGHKVEREYYINDAGNQVLTLGKVLKGEDDSYQSPYVDELKEQIDTSMTAEAVGSAAVDELLSQIQETISRMGIKYDVWFSERQELHDTGEVERVLEDLKKADAVYEKEGAVWLKSTEGDDDKDRVLRKSDGGYTYVMADIAYHRHKFVVRKFDRVINIWGADHHGDVARLKYGVEVVRKVEPFTGQLDIVITQFVRLVSDGKEVKMSKRAGTFVTLDELLDEVDVDVARFFFIMRSFDTHMDFDLDLAKEQSQKNPVYYLKYAFARISGILSKAEEGGKADLSKLTEPAELALIKQLAEFPATISQTAEDHQIHRLPHYALGIADAFHKFYEQCRVITDDKDLSAARLQLVQGTKIVLQNVGDTLGITMPEKM